MEDKEKNILYLSQIFKWFRSTFEKKYGSLLEMAKKYMKLVDTNENLYGYMLLVEIKESQKNSTENTRKFYDGLNMIWRATDLGRVKTVATLNAISTHQQQGEEGRALASLKSNAIRIAVGIEDPSDVIADIDKGFANIK